MENWEKYWSSNTILTRIITFMRVRFFGKISISHLGNLNGKNILEAGCGTGESLVNITRKAKKLTGLDISKSILELTRKNFEKHNIKKEKYWCIIPRL